MNPVQRAKLLNGGLSQKAFNIADGKRLFVEQFNINPDLEKDTLINGVNQPLIVYDSTMENEKNFQTHPMEVVHIGDVVQVYGSYWLVTELNLNKQVFQQGLLKLCNRQLFWQDPITQAVLSSWAIISNPTLNTEDAQSTITTEKGRLKITVPRNEYTEKIKVDKRLVLDVLGGIPVVYKISYISSATTSYVGEEGALLYWHVEIDVVKPEDNAELFIADYIDNTSSEGVNQQYSCEIIGSTEISVGYYRNYQAIFKDVVTEEIVVDVGADWYIENIADVEEYIIMEITENTCKIRVLNVDKAINKKVVLCCSSVDGNSDLFKFEISLVVL